VDVISNSVQFPSPVLPTGSMHSVTQCLVTTGGTQLSIKKLTQIYGLDKQTGLVHMQTGVKLADLHDWLGAQVGRTGTACRQGGGAPQVCGAARGTATRGQSPPGGCRVQAACQPRPRWQQQQWQRMAHCRAIHAGLGDQLHA